MIDLQALPSPLLCSLYVSLAMNVFRVFMYVVNLDGATTVKVTKQAWENLDIREVMYTHTKFIRRFMAYRAIICGWAIWMLEEGPAMNSLCILQALYDLYLMRVIVKKAGNKKDRVMKHQNIVVPATLQAVLCIMTTGLVVVHNLKSTFRALADED